MIMGYTASNLNKGIAYLGIQENPTPLLARRLQSRLKIIVFKQCRKGLYLCLNPFPIGGNTIGVRQA
jgi:hypothetical protein